MGFFSWQCAKTKKPVMAEMGVRGSPWEFASKVRVLFKDGSVVHGRYDGYGRVIGNTEVELLEFSETNWRMVIDHYYDGETFDQLEKNKNEPKQGWFWDDNELKEIFSVR